MGAQKEGDTASSSTSIDGGSQGVGRVGRTRDVASDMGREPV